MIFSLQYHLNTQSREMVMRINTMINQGKSFDLLSNYLYWFFIEMYGDHFAEFVSGYQGLNKGLSRHLQEVW